MSNKPTAKKAFSQKTVTVNKRSRKEASSSSSSALPAPVSYNKYILLSQRGDFVALQGVFVTMDSANVCKTRLESDSNSTNTVYTIKHVVFPEPATPIAKE